jgi:hypothetical protein
MIVIATLIRTDCDMDSVEELNCPSGSHTDKCQNPNTKTNDDKQDSQEREANMVTDNDVLAFFSESLQ